MGGVGVSLCLVVLMSFCSLQSAGQNFFRRQWDIFNRIMDRLEDSGYDTVYMEPIGTRWMVGSELGVMSRYLTLDGDSASRIETEPRMTIKLKVEYRAVSLSFAKFSFANKEDWDFNFDICGRKWGLDISANKSVSAHHVDGSLADVTQSMLGFNAYYVLKNKQFSYPATRGKQVHQLQSAGSPLFGLSYYYHSADIQDTLLRSGHGVGRILVNNGGISAGYAYNIVPQTSPTWLFSMSVTPTLLFLSRNEITPVDESEDFGQSGWYLSALLPARFAINKRWSHLFLSYYAYLFYSRTNYGGGHYVETLDLRQSLSLGYRFK